MMECEVILILGWALLGADASTGLPYNPCDPIWPGATYTSYGKCILSLGSRFQTGNSIQEEAMDLCARLPYGGRLVEPRSNEELDAMLKLTSSLLSWIGATYDVGNGSYYWHSDGSELPISSTSWGPLQPQNPAAEQCVLMTNYWEPYLHDIQCITSYELGITCELELQNPCDTVYSGSVYIEGFCFKIIFASSTWDDAVAGCDSQGAFLAELKTPALVNSILEYLKPVYDERVYIGGTDNGTEGTFRWVTSQETFTAEMDSSWRGGDPDNWGGIENTVAIQSSDTWGSGMIDQSGLELFPYLCQKAIPVPQHYQFIVVVPAMTSTDSVLSSTRKVYVTTGLLEVVLKIAIFTPSNRTMKYGHATSQTPYILEIDSEMELQRTGVYDKTIAIHSWGSVTVAFVSMATDNAGATLIYPHTLMSGGVDRGRYYFVPSTSLADGSSNQLALSAIGNGTSDVKVYFRLNGSGVALGVDGFVYRNVTVAEITLEQYMTGYSQGLYGVDSLFVLAYKPISVITSYENFESGTDEPDYVIESVLPIEFIDTEYCTFPSFKVDSGTPCQDEIRLVAVYDNTTVEVFGTRTVTLDEAGNTYNLKLSCEQSFFLQGNQPFYVYKFSTVDAINRPCMTSLLPRSLWRSQYDVIVTSEFGGFNISFHVIVETTMMPLLQIEKSRPPPWIVNKILDSQECLPIEGTDMSWCKFVVPSENLDPAVYLHLFLTNHSATFGAYMYATGPGSAVCYALGVNEEAVPTHIFDPFSLLAKMEKELYNVTCEISNEPSSTFTSDVTTSTTVPMATTEDPVISLAEYNLTMEELQNLQDKIYKELVVDVHTTSAYERSLISVPDERLSAKAIGSVGISIVIGTIGLLILPDILKVLRAIWKFCHRLKGKKKAAT